MISYHIFAFILMLFDDVICMTHGKNEYFKFLYIFYHLLRPPSK
jgi:hypothetical protein